MCVVMRLSYRHWLSLFTDDQLPDLMFLRKIAEDDEMFKIEIGDGAVYLFPDMIIRYLAIIAREADKDDKFFFPYAIPTQFVKKLFELKVFYKLVKPCFVYGWGH